MKPETLKRIRAEAEAYAGKGIPDLLDEIGWHLTFGQRGFIESALRTAYLRGADAGYTAAKAEERGS